MSQYETDREINAVEESGVCTKCDEERFMGLCACSAEVQAEDAAWQQLKNTQAVAAELVNKAQVQWNEARTRLNDARQFQTLLEKAWQTMAPHEYATRAKVGAR